MTHTIILHSGSKPQDPKVIRKRIITWFDHHAHRHYPGSAGEQDYFAIIQDLEQVSEMSLTPEPGQVRQLLILQAINKLSQVNLQYLDSKIKKLKK